MTILPNLKKLYISQNVQLKNLPFFESLTKLSLNSCSSLRKIPVLPKLTHLYCDYYLNPKSITIQPNIKYLNGKNMGETYLSYTRNLLMNNVDFIKTYLRLEQ
jgi:hypothetical protein